MDKRAKSVMHRKLTHAERVLEGLANNDFDKITRNAETLLNLTKEAEWMVLKTPGYEVHSNEFRRKVEDVVARAKEKNLDGAALGYVEMTLSCVRCHKYVRGVRMTRLETSQTQNAVVLK